MTKTTSYKIAITIITFAFLLYLWAILKFTAYMPFADDYSVVLRSLNTYTAPDADMIQKFKMLFYQHMESRLVFNKIIELLQYYIFGQVNFLYLVLIGNMGWLLTIYLFWKYSIKNQIVSVITFVPVALMMLAFSHSSLMTWAMGSLQQYWQLFFALYSIYLLTNKHFTQAFIIMIFAIFTSGGGIILIPLFLLYFLTHKYWKLLGISFILSVLILLFYFVALDYKRIDHNIYLFFDYPLSIILFLLTFLGNFGASYPLAAYIGGTLILLYIWISKYLFKYMPFLAWSILYIIITACLVTISRSEHGLIFALPSRYSIYSISFLALIYLGYMKRYQQNKAIYFLGFLVGLSIFIFHFIHKLPYFEQRKHIAETTWAFPRKDFAERVLKQSVKNNIFTSWIGNRPPSFLLNLPKIQGTPSYMISITNHEISFDNNTTKISPLNILPEEKILILNGWAFDQINNNRAYAVIFKLNDKKTLLYLDQYKKSLKALFGKKYPHNSFQNKIDISYLSPGIHKLEIRVINTFATGYYKALTIPIYKLNQAEVNSLPLKDGSFIGGIDKVSYTQNKLHMTGWLLKNNHLPVNEPVLMDIDGEKYTVNYGVARYDVSKVYQNSSALRSGMTLKIPNVTFSKGKHIATIFVHTKNRRSLLKTTLHFEFEVK